MASKKTKVIEWIFNQRFDVPTGSLGDPLVTMADISAGIDAVGDGLSSSNPANFWKDLTRHDARRSWPDVVWASGYFGADAIGEGDKAVFKFVPLAEIHEGLLGYDAERVALRELQSVSMPLAMRALGRTDENWLAQVASRLAVVESHFALNSSRDVREVSFLQTGVKLKRGESDVVYSLRDGDALWLVSVEAKGRNEPLHGPQVARAAHALGESYAAQAGAVGVIPFGMKVERSGIIYCVEFKPVDSPSSPLDVASEGAFKFVPQVPGFG